MFKRIRYYLIAGLVLIVGLILLFNEVFTLGLVIVGISAMVFVLWEFLLKDKVKQIELLNDQLLDRDEENKRLKENIEDYSKRKLNISEITPILD